MHARPKVVRELPAGTRKASAVTWWDGGDTRLRNGEAIVRATEARGTRDALQPPAVTVTKPKDRET